MADETRLSALVIACLVVSLVGTPAVAAPLDDGRAGVAAPAVQLQGNNSTATPVPRHTNPDTDEVTLPQLRGWFGSQMAQVLIDCTEGASAREWGACDLDRDYPDWLASYIDIARETDSDRDDTAAVTFRDARDTQRTFNNRTRAFYEAYERYRAARESGEQRRARRLAREAVALAVEVDATGAELREDYRVITANSRANLTVAGQQVGEISANVTALAEQVEGEAFVRTRLSARVAPERPSFVDPVRVTGRLTASNGTALADRTIQFRLANRTLRTRTNATGAYRFTYRPTTVAAGQQSVRVRYVPRPTSAYAVSNATVAVSIAQIEPNVSVSVTPVEAGFDDRVTLSGRVHAAGNGAPGVPMSVGLGDQRLGRIRTDETGRFTTTVTVPASVPAGEQTGQATVALDGRALARATGTTPIRIQSTPTVLTLDAGQVGESRSLQLRGRLRTASGTPLAGQAITLRLDDSTATTATTDATGQYTTRVAIPPAVLPASASNVTVRVRVQGIYRDQGTNLEAAQTSTTVNVTVPPAQVDNEPFGDGTLGAVLGTIVNVGTGILGTIAELLSSLDPFESIVSILSWTVFLLLFVLVVGVALAWRLDRLDEVRGWVATGGDTDLPAWVKRLPEGIRTVASEFRAWLSSHPLWARWDGESTGSGHRDDDEFTPAIRRVTDEPSRPTVRERIRDLLEVDPDAAIVLAYTTVREQLGEELDIPAVKTHWEFLTVCREDSLDPVKLDALETLVETHERAVFAPTTVSAGTAATAVETLDVLLGPEDTQSTDPSVERWDLDNDDAER